MASEWIFDAGACGDELFAQCGDFHLSVEQFSRSNRFTVQLTFGDYWRYVTPDGSLTEFLNHPAENTWESPRAASRFILDCITGKLPRFNQSVLNFRPTEEERRIAESVARGRRATVDEYIPF